MDKIKCSKCGSKIVQCVMAWIMVCVMVMSMVLASPGLSIHTEAASNKYVKSLTVKKSITLEKGKKITVKPVVKVVNKASKGVTVKSKNKKIAKASYSVKKNSIIITGIKEGRTTITVTTKAKNKKGKKISKKINVNVKSASASTEITTTEQPGNTEATTETTTTEQTTTEKATTEATTTESTGDDDKPDEPSGEDATGYTRLDWIKALLNQLDAEYLTADNVATDDNQNALYTYSDLETEADSLVVETAVQYGILKQEETDGAVHLFYPKKAASREFAAVTAVRGLGFIQSNTVSLECTDLQDLKYPALDQIAVTEGMLSLQEGCFNGEEALDPEDGKILLEAVARLKADNVISAEKVADIVYADNLIKDALNDITEYQVEETDSGYIVTLPDVNAEELGIEPGKTLYLPENDACPKGFVCKVVSVVSEDGNAVITATDIESIADVFESFHMSGSSSEGELIPAEGVTITDYSEADEETLDSKLDAEGSIDIPISVSGKKKIEKKVGNITFTGTLTNPEVYYDFKGTKEGISSLKLSVKNNITLSASASGEASERIELFKKAVPLDKGFEVVVTVYCTVSVEGKLEFSCDISAENGINVNGNHNITPIKVLDVDTNASCDVSYRSGPEVEAMLVWLDEDFLAVADVQIGAGCACDVNLQVGVNVENEELHCVDSDLYAYLTISAGKNEKSLLHKLLKKYDISASYDIFGKDNSPLRANSHMESLGSSLNYQQVASCTRVKNTLSGYVYDKEGVILPCAHLTIQSTANPDIVYQPWTNNTGYYSCKLANGEYNITVTGNGEVLYENVMVSIADGDVSRNFGKVVASGEGLGYLWTLTEEGHLLVEVTDDTNPAYVSFNSIAGDAIKKSVLSATVCGKVKHLSFEEFGNLESVDLSECDTSNVTDMKNMFYWCSSLSSLDLSSFDTSNVTDMKNMFYWCSSLSSLDLSSFDTSNVTNMSTMFYNCSSLSSLDLSSFDTSNVTDMSSMFSMYTSGSLTELDLSSFDTTHVTNMNHMFCNCTSLAELDLSSFDTGNVIDMHNMFLHCSGLTELNLSSFDTSQVTDMTNMFIACRGLKELDLSSFNTSNISSMSSMFNECESLTELDLSSFDTSQVTDMTRMFYGCTSLTGLDLSSFNTSNVSSMSYMFNECESLTELDLSSFDTSVVGFMSHMFNRCSNLTKLDVSNFNTGNVGIMDAMFSQCESLTELDLSKFDTSQVIDMSSMFSGCSGLTNLVVDDFVIKQGCNFEDMFYHCDESIIPQWYIDLTE